MSLNPLAREIISHRQVHAIFAVRNKEQPEGKWEIKFWAKASKPFIFPSGKGWLLMNRLNAKAQNMVREFVLNSKTKGV